MSTTPTLKKEPPMSGIKSLVGRKMTKQVGFMGDKVTINKLSVAEVLDIQEKANNLEDDKAGFDILKTVIRSSVEGASDLTDEDFETFAMDELSKLSDDILKFSGIGQEVKK
jgi:hypothetical protein